MEIPLTGNIKDVSLVKILVHLNRNRKSGILSLVTPVFTKKMYLNAGDVVFASSTYQDDRLGEMLLKANKITVEQYDKAAEVLTSSRNKRLGAILVELGYLTPKDLFWGVKYQVKEIIHREGELPTQEVITLKMSMGNLIYEGVKRIENWTRIRQEMPDTGLVFKLSEDPLSLFQGIELNSQDKKILTLIDGRRTIREVIESSWMGSFEALKILYVLWSTGIIEQKPEAAGETGAGAAAGEKAEEVVSLDDILKPVTEEEETLQKRVDEVYSRLDSLKVHELLEVDEKDTVETIKKNYFRLAKEFHPDRYFTFADESVKTKLTAIFDAITRAYNTLKDEDLRAEYFGPAAAGKKEKAPEGVKADDQFRRGVAEFKKGNFEGAAENFKWAAKLMPKNAGYWNYLSLAYSKMQGRLKEAEESLVEAIRLEPSNPDFYANMGLIYLKAGLRKKARSNFEKALNIDASNEKAKKGLEQSKE